MKTPNVEAIVEAVQDEFGPRVSVGAWACRRIAGTLTWSQHSWTENPKTGVIYAGNAADIFPDNMAVGDQVEAFIRENFHRTVAHLLWRVKDHFDHVHVDTWPQGYGTPPCKGGSLRVKYEDGSIGRTFYREEDLPLNADDLKKIRALIVDVLGGDRIEWTPPGEAARTGNRGVVNSVWHPVAHGRKMMDTLEGIYDWSSTPGGEPAGTVWQNLLRTKTNTDKIIDELT